jgi:CBS domain-containing protein
MQKGKAKGIITERDIVYKVIANGKNPKTTKLSSVMSRPLKVIKASDRVESAASALRANKIKRLPVVDRKGKLVGIVTEGDLLRVYPGMIDVVSEMQEIRKSKPNEVYTGVCDICG